MAGIVMSSMIWASSASVGRWWRMASSWRSRACGAARMWAGTGCGPISPRPTARATAAAMFAETSGASEVSSPHAGDFRATVTLADLGPARLTVLTYPETRSVRTAALIRRSDPERHGLILIMQSVLWFSQCDRSTRVGTGDLTLLDTSQPYELRALPMPTPGRH